MKIYLKLLLILATLPLFLISCDDEPEETGNTGNITVSFGTPTLKAMENVSPLQIAIVLSQPAPRDIVVDIAVRREDGVKEGTDYTLRNHKVTIAKGEAGSYAELNLKDNLKIMPDRTLELELVNAQGAILAAESVVCKITIISNEGYPTLGFAETLTSVDENGGDQEFKVSLTRPQTEDVVFHVEATDGTAINGTHYNLKLGEYTIPAGDTSALVAVEIIDDIDVNDNRNFQLRITDATNAIVSEIYATNDITIVNDDRQTYASFIETQFKVIESDGEVSIPVHLTGTPRKDIRVRIAVSSVSTAREGKDYTLPENMILDFPLGTTEQTLVIPILDNEEVDLSRSLNLIIDSVWNALPAEENTFCSITISNDDFDPVQLYDDLQGTYQFKCTPDNAAAETSLTILAGDNLEEENNNYLRILRCRGVIPESKFEITWDMKYNIDNPHVMTIPMNQIVTNVPYWHTPSSDIRFWLNINNEWNEEQVITVTWNKDFTQCSWNIPGNKVYGVIHPVGNPDPKADGRYWFTLQEVTLTRQ